MLLLHFGIRSSRSGILIWGGEKDSNQLDFGSNFRFVAKGPTALKSQRRITILGPPRSIKDMPTPNPYILIVLTPQEAAAEGGGPFFYPCDRMSLFDLGDPNISS